MSGQLKTVPDLPALLSFDPDAELPAWSGGSLKRLKLSVVTSLTRVVALEEGSTAEVALRNTDALQALIRVVGEAGGGTIIIPAGSWYLYPVEIVYSYVHIRGEGNGATKITRGPSPLVDLDETFRFGITIGGGVPVAVRTCSIGMMEVDGNRANQVNGTDPNGSNGAAVGVATVVDMTIFEMNIHDCDGYGISFFGTDFAGRSDWYVYNVETHHNNYDGIDIKGGTTNKPTRIDFAHVYSHDNGPGNIVGRDSVGFDLRGEHITLTGCEAYNNTQNGFRIRDGSDGCYSATLIGCNGRVNATAGLQVDGIAAGVYTVIGGEYKGNTAYGCRQEGGHLVMQGVTLSGQSRGYTNFTTACSAELIGCVIQDNTDWGVRADVSGTRVRIGGGKVRRNGREGVRAACTSLRMRDVDVLDNDQANQNSAGILLLSTVTDWAIEGCRSTNQEGVTQNYGIEFQGGLGPGILNALLTGNSAAATTGTMPVGTLYYGTSARSVPVVV